MDERLPSAEIIVLRRIPLVQYVKIVLGDVLDEKKDQLNSFWPRYIQFYYFQKYHKSHQDIYTLKTRRSANF